MNFIAVYIWRWAIAFSWNGSGYTRIEIVRVRGRSSWRCSEQRVPSLA
jgi:hypothetical protein